MDSDKIEALSKWEIKGLDAKQAIDWLISVNVISGHTALFGLAYFIHCQQQRESDLQQRLRELDEKNQTQAKALAARDKIIQMQADAINEQNRMIEKAINAMAAASRCVFSELQRCPDDSTEIGCPGCVRRWLEATP